MATVIRHWQNLKTFYCGQDKSIKQPLTPYATFRLVQQSHFTRTTILMDQTNKYKIRLLSLALFLSIVIIPYIANSSLWFKLPLVYRIMKADYVIIGRLTDVKKQAVFIEHKDFLDRGKFARFYLDTGTILATKKLFPLSVTQQNLSPKALKFPFASYSRSHPQGDGNYMKSSAHFYFDEGAEGIWLLQKAFFADHLTVVRPDNFLPIDSLSVVESAIVEVSKFLSEQKQSEKR